MSDRRTDSGSGQREGCGENVGAYLLGALDESEHAAFERHLETCKLCREDVAQLHPVVDALPQAVPQFAAPPAIKARLMATIESEAALQRTADAPVEAPSRPRMSRRLFPRPAFAAAIAATALACGVAAGVVFTGGDDDPGGGIRTHSADVAGSEGRATLLVGQEGATLKVAGMPSPPADRVYQVWLQREGNAPDPTDAMFTVDQHGAGTVAVPGSLEGIDQVLVTAEPRGGSQVPTRLPVITARLGAA